MFKTPVRGGAPQGSGSDSEEDPSLPGASVARKLLPSPLTKFDSSEAETIKNTSVYLHTTRILKSVIPNEEEMIEDSILELFLVNQIRNDLSFSLLSPSDFPTQGYNKLWGMGIFRKALTLVIQSSTTSELTEDSTLKTIQGNLVKVGSPGDFSLNSPGTSSTQTSLQRFSLKAIQQIELQEYSGETDKYIEWFESTERRFGQAAAQPLLLDEDLCEQHIDVSYAAKCIVANSLENGSASHLNTTYKYERNLARFMTVINNQFNKKVDARTREFTQWKKLFTLQLEKSDDSDNFVNQFETCVSKLREHNSKAVGDEALMRALILHAIRAKEFEHRKLEITTDLKMDVSKILDTLRLHFMALKTNDHLTGTGPGQKQVRFAGRVQRDRDDERKHNGNKNNKGERKIWVPELPKDLKEVVSDAVFERLVRWRNLANKKNKSNFENKLIRGESYTLFKDGQRPPKPQAISKKKYMSDDDDSYRKKEYRQQGRRRSPRDNRHSGGSRKVRRTRDERYESYSSYSDTGSVTSDSDFGSRKRHKRDDHKQKEEPEKKKRRKSRSTSNVPQGILVPRQSGYKK